MSRHFSVLLALLSLVACAERLEPEPKLVPASRELTPEETRLSPLSRTHRALTEARCDRQARCNAIGEELRFTTRAECVTHFDWLGYGELELFRCRTPVDEEKLSSCLYAIKTEPCGSAEEIDNMTRACSSTEICGAPEAPAATE